MAKQKYNPDDIERWVTVKGARIPIMKDGTMGIGTKEDGTKVSASSGDTLENFEDVTEVLGRKIGWVNYRELSHDWNEFSKDPKKYKKSVVPDMVNLWADEKLKKLKEREKTGEVYKQSNPYGAQSVMNDNRKPTSRNARYDTSRAKKNKPPIEDRFSFHVAMPHPNASNDSQMKATTKLAVSQITKQFEDSGIKLSKVGAFDGSQFFIPDKGSYVVELSRTSRGDSKNQVSFNTRIWDNSTATGKNLIKRFKK